MTLRKLIMATIKTPDQVEAENAAAITNPEISDDEFARIMADSKAKAEREAAASTPAEIGPSKDFEPNDEGKD